MSASVGAEVRKEVCAALVHCLVSNQGLWDTVDIAEAKRRMDAALAAVPWRPLSLVPLWEYFKEVGTPDVPARETMLFFASRGVRWGIVVSLPPELEALGANERAAHVEHMRSLGGSSGTFVGRAPVAPLQGAPVRGAPGQEAALPGAPPQDALPRTATPMARKVKWAAPRAEVPSPEHRHEREHTEANLVAPPAEHWLPRAVPRQVIVAALVIAVLAVAGGFRRGSPPAAHEAALQDLCSDIVSQGHAILCTAAPAVLADPVRAAERVDAIRVALDATLVFVDANGNVLDPVVRLAQLSADGPRRAQRVP